MSLPFRLAPAAAAICLLALSGISAPKPAMAQVTAFKQAVAETASQDDDIAAYYRKVNYAPLWTGEGDEFRARRAELMRVLKGAEAHGLPASRYDVSGLMEKMAAARTTRDIGLVEVELSRVFLAYARDVHQGSWCRAPLMPVLCAKCVMETGPKCWPGSRQANRAFT